jgi:hypothetical protein
MNLMNWFVSGLMSIRGIFSAFYVQRLGENSGLSSMLDKQVYDLTADDINQYSVWYFPMDDSVEDELTVRPVVGGTLPGDYQTIVRAVFTSAKGKEFVGYIYWSDPKAIENIKPVLFAHNSGCITFWNGVIKPSWADCGPEQVALNEQLPLAYKSESTPNLPTLLGVLEGLYYIDESDIIQYL